MLTPEQQQFIEAELPPRGGGTRLREIGGIPVLIKQLEPARRHGLAPLANALAAILGLPMLRSVPVPGAMEAQVIETHRLETLKAAGASVPNVLHAAPRWLALSFPGENSLDHMLRTHPEIAQRYWESGLDAILVLHRLGQNASLCLARNMIWHDGKVSFINFEDDPAASMPLSSAQARDWMLYLHSTAGILNMAPEHIAAVFLRHLHKDQPAVRHEVLRAARTFGWLRILPATKKTGVVTMQATASVLHQVAVLARRERAIF